MMARNFICAAAVALSLTGCSSFHKEWKAASKAPIPSGVNGLWEGEWRSEKNGHHGSLRCILEQTSPATFRAHFRAKYMKVLRYTYVATLTGQETNGVIHLKGSADLGKLAGGVYTYESTVTPAEFDSTYACKWDNGGYRMTRPPAAR